VAAERRRGRGCGALQPRARRDLALEELAHDAVGELALELPDARGQHPQAAGGRPLAQVGEEPALADPGGPLDQRHPAAALPRVAHERIERGDLGVALEQRHVATPRAAASSRRDRMPSFR
jgi:hypothetical protein